MTEIKDDIYKFKNGTLKNKLNITDPKVLQYEEYKEADINQAALLSHPEKVKTNSLSDLSKIHQYMFGNIYYWAGVTRDNLPGHPDLQKNGHNFLPNAMMSNATQYINNEIKSANQKEKPDKLDYANMLMDINDLHPFYEGNGRATKTFLQTFAKHHGQEINYPRHQKELINAMNSLDPQAVADHIKLEDIDHKPEQAEKGHAHKAQLKKTVEAGPEL